jgi:hypothetical protein
VRAREGASFEPLTFRFRYTPEEYAAGLRLHRGYSHGKLALAAIALLAASIALSLFSPLAGLVMGVLSMVLVVLVFVIGVTQPASVFRRDPYLQDEWEFTFTERGVSGKSAYGEALLYWTQLGRIQENAMVVVIPARYGIAATIPKRVLREQDPAGRFRVWVAELLHPAVSRLETSAKHRG